MAVNMEVENTTKEIDTRLSANDSTEFSDGIEKTKECHRSLQNSLSSLKKLTIDGNKYEDPIRDQTLNDSESRGTVDRVSKDENCEETTEDLSVQQNSPEEKNTSTNEDESKAVAKIDESSANGHVSQALAFTIDFGNNKEVDTAKYQNLFERYNARHKRNLSTSKVDVSTKKSNTLLPLNQVQQQKPSSTHSEGYFSSEDDTKKKAEQLSEKMKQFAPKSILKTKPSRAASVPVNKQESMTKSNDNQAKPSKLSRKNLSLELGHTKNTKPYWEAQKSATINDLSRVQTSNYDDDTEKLYTKNIDPSDIENEWENEKESKHLAESISEKVSNLNYAKTKSLNLRDHNLSSVSYSVEVGQEGMTETNIDVFNVSNIDAGSDGAVSEAGTYTIHKDYTDEEKARMDIDKVFSVGVLREDECNESYVHSFKMSVSRDNNTWISEWATQVAEHNSLPPIIGGATGRTPPLSPSKIPSPIDSRSRRLARNRNEQSDTGPDMESYLRIKERFAVAPNQNTLIDSGGESDDDTSNSYNTPPHSSQRTPVHSSLARRGSLSESLFRRINTNETRRSLRKYLSSNKSKTEDMGGETITSPSHDYASLGRRSSSLDRREYTSDTPESNTSRRSSTKYQGDESPYINSPILSRVRPSTPKLTNSPIVTRKTIAKIINSPVLDKAKHLKKSPSQAKNIGYFTCIENSPYMLRKSNSTTSYHESSMGFNSRELTGMASNALLNTPNLSRNLNIQRSCSNTNIKNAKSQNVLSRRSSLNSSDIDRSPSERRCAVASDSSSEAGEQQTKSSIGSISSGLKLNRAFSIRRARLNCESDTTPNTTPEERRRRAQTESKTPLSNKQPNHRSRGSSVGVYNKESTKKPEPAKVKTPLISRTDTNRFSGRATKTSQQTATTQRPTQKPAKENKKSARSNSTLTSKEVEFQNWKRRKSYDPMKAAAEGKKKLIDSTKKHHSTEDSSGNHDSSVLRSASFHGTGGTLALANDWSDNELNYCYEDNQVPPPCSPQLGSDSDDFETSYHLQTTQNVVSAMSARMTMHGSPLINSDNESDDDTSQSLHHNSQNITHQPSDTESSDERQPAPQSVTSSTKYNRAFSLRRARVDTQPTKTVTINTSKNKSTTREVRGKPEATSISRTDSGRFSMRITKSSNTGPKAKPKETKKPAIPNTKEVEMQNWKRRKSYDPMKAAMEGRKKANLAKKSANANLSPSHVARSQSFHGSVGFAGNWSDDELVASADEAEIYY